MHDCYAKQIKKVELTYKAIFAALESHRQHQINKLRELQSQQTHLISQTKLELDEALLKRKQWLKTPRGDDTRKQPDP